MKTLYLLCGMPFSGKTTLAKALIAHLHASYISLDDINESRGLFGGEGIPVEEWEKTHSIAMQQLHSLMELQQDIVLDDTSCFRWLRDRYRDFAVRQSYQTVLIYLDSAIAEIQRRMEENTKTEVRHGVRQSIVDEMAKTFEPPQPDEVVIQYSPDQRIEEWVARHFAKNAG
jgi:predicted kinase